MLFRSRDEHLDVAAAGQADAERELVGDAVFEEARRTAREIAADLFISARTAEHHVQHVYTKIGVTGRAAATRWALEHDLV